SSLKMGIFNRIWVDISPRRANINRTVEVDTSPLMASKYSLMEWGDGSDKDNTNDRHLIAIIENSLEPILKIDQLESYQALMIYASWVSQFLPGYVVFLSQHADCSLNKKIAFFLVCM